MFITILQFSTGISFLGVAECDSSETFVETIKELAEKSGFKARIKLHKNGTVARIYGDDGSRYEAHLLPKLDLLPRIVAEAQLQQKTSGAAFPSLETPETKERLRHTHFGPGIIITTKVGQA